MPRKVSPPLPNTTDPDTLLTAHDVARKVRVSTRTVRRLVAEGRLPVIRIGRLVRFRARDVRLLFSPE